MSRCWIAVLATASACGGQARAPAASDRLGAIRIVGNHAIASDALEPALALHEAIGDGAAADPYLLALDTERIRAAYVKRGFFAVRVTPTVATPRSGGQVVVFTIYSTDTLFAFFLGGEPSSDVNNPTRDQARAAVLGATARLVSGKLGQQISKVLPVRIDVSCEPSPNPATTSAGSCTAGRWLLDQVFLAYRQRLQPRPEENAGEAQLQIRLGNRLLLEGTVGDSGHHGADLLWRQRW